VQWCPRNPDLLATAFFDGTIGIHSIQSTNEVSQGEFAAATPQPDGADVFDNPSFARTNQASFTLKQPPKWLCRPTSASFGYSGQLVTVSNLGNKEGRHQSGVVHIRRLATEDNIVARAERLRQAIDSQDLSAVAIERSAEAEAVAADVSGWKALLSLFHADSRDELVTLLGFSKSEIAARVAEAIAKLRSAAEESTPLPVIKSPSDEDVSDSKPHGPVVSFAEPERSPPANAEDLLDATPSEVSAGAASDTSVVTPLPDAESTTTAPSLFGDDGPAGTPQLDAAADFFSTMGLGQSTNQALPVVPHTNYAIDSSVAATIGSRPSSAASDALKSNNFYIYPADESETDRLVTKALVVGDFESAVSLCLSMGRFADAILLAVKGGPELLARTQKAYFEKRTVALPYLRLFQSIVTNDLADIVQNADLQDWQEIFVVLCTFAGADEFGGLAEQLGARLEYQASLARSEQSVVASELRKNAMLAYLAAGRLERLINIWIEELTEEEVRILADETVSGISRYTAHAHALQTFIEKVTVFRAAASYVDKDLETKSVGENAAARTYKLSTLYDRYFEYADFLATQGLVKHAVAFLKLTPAGYKGAPGTHVGFVAGRERLLIAAGVSKETPVASSSRIEVSAPAVAPAAPAAPSTIPTSTSTYPYNPYGPAVPQQASAHATATAAPTSYSYAPTNVPPVPNNPYAPMQPVQGQYQPIAPMTYPSGNAYSQHPPQPHGGQIAHPPGLPFGAPRATPPPIAPPPPPKRRENGGWNDAPPVSERRTPSGSTNKPAAITSPFPHAGPVQGSVSNSMYSARDLSPAPAPPPPRPASVQARAPPPPAQGRIPVPPPHMAPAPGPYSLGGPGPVPSLAHPPNVIPAGQQPPPGQYAPPQRGHVASAPPAPAPPPPNPYSHAAPPPGAGAPPLPPQARQVPPPPSGPYGRVASPQHQQPHPALAPPPAGPARVPPPGGPQSVGGQHTGLPPPRQGPAAPKYR
jgi:protein transport protein SEC31